MSTSIDSELREALKRIIAYEEKRVEDFNTNPNYYGLDPQPYWELMVVPIEWKHVRKLILGGLVEKFGKKYYLLKDRAAVKDLLLGKDQEKLERDHLVEASLQALPDDLFDVIEGYEDLKTFFQMTLQSEKPVHCLLLGAPGTAKSVFLMELERIGGKFITAGTATGAGIRDILYEELPKLLLIDEIDKNKSSTELSALLTWMESGRIIITKHGLRDERRGKGWVFAAANTKRGLPEELLDRFQVFHIKPYTKEEFLLVVERYLHKRMKLDPQLAQYIATETQKFSHSIRQAIRLARLAKTPEEVDIALKVVQKYAVK